ncbi:MAG: two-component regulator propeller domain-containing protein [Spirochaetales bacterium]|nr:two-component regulator propeller domain-containing protein [Spirochaetales bacterium]
MKKTFCPICLAILWGILGNIYAIDSLDSFNHFDEKSGLVNAIVSGTQDKQGFLWFGTEGGNGVFRYDGKDFQQFTHDPTNPNSLLPGNVYNIICDRQGQLWFSTSGGGLSRYTPETETFTNFIHSPEDNNSIGANSVYSILEDREGHIWVATASSLDRYTPETGEFQHYYPDPENGRMLQSSIAYHMYESRDGMIWLGTYGGGLNMYDPGEKSFTVYRHDPDNPATIAHDTCGAVVEDELGDIWVGGKGGISRLNRETGQFTRYVHYDDNEHSIADNYIWDMVFDDEGTLWTGGFGGGLGRLDPSTGLVDRFMYDPKDSGSLSSNLVWFVYKDREDILWVGTPDGGLNKFAYAAKQFAHYRHVPDDPGSFPVRSLFSIYEDSQGIIWLGGQGHDSGLTRWDIPKDDLTVIPNGSLEKGELPSGEIQAFLEDPSGNLLIGQYGGLTKYEKEENRFSRLFPREEDKKRYSDVGIRKIAIDKEGNLWVASEIGVVYFNKGEENYSLLFESLSISTIFVDSEGRVWIGTMGGEIYRHTPGLDSWYEYKPDRESPGTLKGGQIYNIIEDEEKNIWLGSADGLYLWDWSNDSFQLFNRDDGLSSNAVYNIKEDSNGYIWLGTANGLDQFNRSDFSVHNYTASDGLQGNEFSMRRDGALAGSDGYFYFVGRNGLSRFNPLRVATIEGDPEILLTSVKVLNEEIDLGVAPFALDSLDLSWKDSMITFDFIALDFLNPHIANYAYKLEGFDREWVELGKEAKATYTNLDGGSYTFRVKVSLQPGVWSKNELSLPVNITTPWWKRWWAFLSYLFLIGAMIVLYMRIRMRRILTLNRKLEEKVESRTRELARTNKELMNKERLASLGNLVAGVAHEINTPLGVAVTASTFLTETNDNLFKALQSGSLGKNELIDYMKTIDESSEIVSQNLIRASELVQSFKQVAVNQSSERATRFNLTKYLNTMLMTLKHEFNNTNIQVSLGFTDALWINSFPSAFSQIFTNLIMNSLNHAFEEGEKGMILINKEDSEKSLELTYRDSGKGIAKENIGRIFDPFFTTNLHNGGSGLGLSVIYNIVNDKLSGSITCESEPGQGVLFRISLPLANSKKSK